MRLNFEQWREPFHATLLFFLTGFHLHCLSSSPVLACQKHRMYMLFEEGIVSFGVCSQVLNMLRCTINTSGTTFLISSFVDFVLQCCPEDPGPIVLDTYKLDRSRLTELTIQNYDQVQQVEDTDKIETGTN